MIGVDGAETGVGVTSAVIGVDGTETSGVGTMTSSSSAVTGVDVWTGSSSRVTSAAGFLGVDVWTGSAGEKVY